MTTIKRDGFEVSCIGHADDKICCAMLTALTVSLLNNLSRIRDNPEYELRDGYFCIDTRDLSIEGGILMESYVYSLQLLSLSYPNNFIFID